MVFKVNRRAANMARIVSDQFFANGRGEAQGPFTRRLELASHKRYIDWMKNASLPSIRVETELRHAVESALRDGESLSEFMENSVRQALERRRHQDAFVARGLASLAAVREGHDLVDAQDVLGKLQQRLAAARASRLAGGA